MKKAHEILQSLLDNYSPLKGETYHTFFRSWVKIAGTDVAAHSKIEDIRGGIVFVSVDHPGWIQIIQMKKNSLLKTMQSRYPELGITDLRLHLYKEQDY